MDVQRKAGGPGRLTRRALLSLQMLTVSLMGFHNLKSSFYAKRMYTILAENNCFHHLQFPSFTALLPVRFSGRRAWLTSATFRWGCLVFKQWKIPHIHHPQPVFRFKAWSATACWMLNTCCLSTSFTSSLATDLRCIFTFNTALASLVTVYEAASGQELMTLVLNTMDQQC